MAVKQSEILGLFASPLDVQALQRQQIANEAQMFAGDPLAQLTYSGFREIGQAVPGMFGATSPVEAEAQRIEDIRKSVDFDPENVSEYYKKLSKRLIDAGLTKAGTEALKLAQNAEAAEATGESKTARMKDYEAYLALTPEQRKLWDQSQGRVTDPERAAALAQAKAEGTTVGKVLAEKKMSFPEREATLNEMIANVESLASDPGFGWAVGRSSLLPTIPGGQTADFEFALEQLKDQAFLTQFDKLRGAGAITEAEGRAARNALTALNLGMSEKRFLEELEKLKSLLNKAKERAAKGIIVEVVDDSEVPVEEPSQPTRRVYDRATGTFK